MAQLTLRRGPPHNRNNRYASTVAAHGNCLPMNDRSRQLLEAAQSGENSDYEALLSALRDDPLVGVESIVEFCQSPNVMLRRAAVELGKERRDQRLCDALAALAG